MIDARGVEFAYARGVGTGPAFAIRDLSFAVEAGEVLSVIGPNASGKTTLVRLLSRVLRPDRGALVIEGREISGLSRAEIARRVAVVPQDLPAVFPYTVGELVLMGRFPHGPARFFESAEDRAAAAEAMAEAGVAHLAAEPLARLSGGERQRVALARALAQNPRLLVLDEPTAHLDLSHQVEAVTLLRRLNRMRGLTVVLVSHDLDLASEISHRIMLMAEGRLVRVGSPAAVLEAGLLEAVYRCPLAVDTGLGRPRVRPIWPVAGGR